MAKICSNCGSLDFRRVSRNSFLERHILPRFCFFPWECVLCRHKFYFRAENQFELRKTGRRTPDSDVNS